MMALLLVAPQDALQHEVKYHVKRFVIKKKAMHQRHMANAVITIKSCIEIGNKKMREQRVAQTLSIACPVLVDPPFLRHLFTTNINQLGRFYILIYSRGSDLHTGTKSCAP